MPQRGGGCGRRAPVDFCDRADPERERPGRWEGRVADRDVTTHPTTHRMVGKPDTPTGREWCHGANGRPERRWLVGKVPGFRRLGVRCLDGARENKTWCGIRKSPFGGSSAQQDKSRNGEVATPVRPRGGDHVNV